MAAIFLYSRHNIMLKGRSGRRCGLIRVFFEVTDSIRLHSPLYFRESLSLKTWGQRRSLTASDDLNSTTFLVRISSVCTWQHFQMVSWPLDDQCWCTGRESNPRFHLYLCINDTHLCTTIELSQTIWLLLSIEWTKPGRAAAFTLLADTRTAAWFQVKTMPLTL